ncbi:MAG TPA: hypothetical protein PKC80_02445 [Burkholderiaceae bacterium]|nr:hypothetical protein [Burkholderiaceae bacterium]
MVLSVTQAHLAAEQATAAGLTFTPVVDHRIASNEWQSALQKFASQSQINALKAAVLSNSEPLCSSTLIDRDAYLHFPTAFVLHNKTVQPQKLVGAMPAHFWQQGIALRLASAVASDPSQNQCIAPNQFIALDPSLAGLDDNQHVALGAYERVSPDGRFILRSFSGSKLTTVSLVELPGPALPNGQQMGQQRIYETPLSNEAFPVQGSWRYLVDINGSHYTFNSILGKQKQAKPLFSGGMTGFYAVASEVDSSYPDSINKPIQIRSLSWPNATADGEVQGQGTLSSMTLTIDPTTHQKISSTGAVTHCIDRSATDGSMYALPMISVDGTEFAALPQKPVNGVPAMRIFGLGAKGTDCIPQGQFKLQSGKIIFGYSDKKADIHANAAYEYRGHVWWYQRALDAQLNLAPWFDDRDTGTIEKPVYKDVTANAFPGITRDGRVIYAANWRRCTGGKTCKPEGGYVVADPWQSNAYKNHLQANPNLAQAHAHKLKACITLQDVIKERAAFAAFHGITN